MSRTANSVHPRLVFGSVLVIIGFLFLFEHLLPTRIDIGDFWPLALIIWGIARFSTHGSKGWAFSCALMVFGALFLLEDVYPFYLIMDWDNIWPIAIIAFGGYLISKNLNQRRASEDMANTGLSNELKAFTCLGGRKSVINSTEFSGGSVTVALGGLEIDCRQAKLSTQTSEVTLDLTVLMGGVELIVPADWAVVVRATPFLGGIDDKRTQSHNVKAGGTTLIIDGVVVLGGVEIISPLTTQT